MLPIQYYPKIADRSSYIIAFMSPFPAPAPEDFCWATGIEDTFIPHTRPGMRALDEYELTQHYCQWRTDFEGVAEGGAKGRPTSAATMATRGCSWRGRGVKRRVGVPVRRKVDTRPRVRFSLLDCLA